MTIDKEKILNVAQKYMLKGQSEKAIKEYQKLIRSSPKDIRSHLKVGDLYLKNGEGEKAIEQFMRVADLYMEEDLNSRAISVYKKVLSLDPKRIEALHRIAKLYLKEGLKGDAKNYYQTILKIKSNDQEALAVLKSLEDHQAPREAPKKVPPGEAVPAKHRQHPEHHPEKKTGEENLYPPSSPTFRPSGTPFETEARSVDKDAEMHYHLGIAYKEMDLYDYAVQEFELAAANPAMNFDCYIMLGDCFMQKGDLEKSIKYYKTASDVKGLSVEKQARLHYNLGCAYEANGMASEALDAFTHVLKLDESMSKAQEKIRKLQKLQER